MPVLTRFSVQKLFQISNIHLPWLYLRLFLLVLSLVTWEKGPTPKIKHQRNDLFQSLTAGWEENTGIFSRFGGSLGGGGCIPSLRSTLQCSQGIRNTSVPISWLSLGTLPTSFCISNTLGLAAPPCQEKITCRKLPALSLSSLQLLQV